MFNGESIMVKKKVVKKKITKVKKVVKKKNQRMFVNFVRDKYG